MSFWEELTRRRVVRVTITYVVVAFGAVQAADVFVPALHLPQQTTTFVASAALVGLPVALVLAWMFQFTTSGITRDDGSVSPAPWPLKWTLGAIVIVAAAAVGAFFVMPRAARLDSNRVLVAPFVDRTRDPSLAAVGSMASDWITQGITESAVAVVVDPTALAGEVTAQTTAASDPMADARANGAGTVITGSYYRQGDSLYINAKLTDANDGRVITSLDAASGSASEPVAPVRALRDRVLSALAASLRQDEGKLVLATHLPSYEAYRAYRDAVASANNDERAASLIKAVAIDTTFDMARIEQLHTYAMMSDSRHTDSLINVLNAKRNNLTPVELALFERQRAFAKGDFEATYKAAKKLAALMPGSRTASLEALRINRPREAIREAERVPEGVRETQWNSYYGQVAAALHMLHDYRQEQKVLLKAHRYFRHDSQLLSADVRALSALGRIDEVRARLAESSDLPRTADTFQALRDCALELRVHGFAEDGRKLLDKVVTEMRALPHLDARARYIYQTAVYFSGRDDDIRAMLDSARIGSPKLTYNYAMLLGMLGTIAAQQGRRDEAARVMAELTPPPDDTTSQRIAGVLGNWRARIAARLGDRDQAIALLQDNRMRYSPTQNSAAVYAHIDPDLTPLVGWKPFDDLMKPKE